MLLRRMAITSCQSADRRFRLLLLIHSTSLSSSTREGELNESFTDYLIDETGDLWEQYVEHPFVVQLGRGTLPPEAFTRFLRQGYLYLLHYARVHALAAYKAKSFEEIAAGLTVVQSCLNEVKINVKVSERRVALLAGGSAAGGSKNIHSRDLADILVQSQIRMSATVTVSTDLSEQSQPLQPAV